MGRVSSAPSGAPCPARCRFQVDLGRYFGGIWADLDVQGTHSRHFLAKVAPKVTPRERKSASASPTCIFGALGDEKVWIFRVSHVENVL